MPAWPLKNSQPCVLTPEQSAWWGQGLEQGFPCGEARLPFHLVDGSFQAAQADAELQPSQEVVRRSDQDMQLFIHEAVQGDSFGQMAPGRWKRGKEGPRCSSPPVFLPSIASPLPPHPPRQPSPILWFRPGDSDADLLCDLGQVGPILLWTSDLAFQGLGRPEDTGGNQKTLPFPGRV